MKLQDFYYDLPKELIAQTPIDNRQASRLFVLDREKSKNEHTVFSSVIDYLNSGDCLVINDTKVLPARLLGRGENGGAVELLLLRCIEGDRWEVMVRPGKRVKPGKTFYFGNGKLTAYIEEILEGGNRIAKFSYEGVFLTLLDEIGIMPLPPYIHEKLKDKNRYQTVYAKNLGSAAAPTAGLHFTPELLSAIKQKGVSIARVTLHVGIGTFKPVSEENIEKHKMHEEYYCISPDTADIINSCKQKGGKVIAVGTTSCRTLESAADNNGKIIPGSGYTEIFIYPGYKFKIIDHLITNFHLPESTLIMLVSAFAGYERTMSAYAEAVRLKYRFFSFGDAMLIL